MARLVDADKLYDKAESKYKCASGNSRQIYRGFLDDIADAPTVDAVEVVHGRWIEHHHFNYAGQYSGSDYECSRCGFNDVYDTEDCNYCPYCGAKMGGDEND